MAGVHFKKKEGVQLKYSIRDVSEITGIKVRTLRSWIKSGKVKFQKDKKTRRYYTDAKEINRIMLERSKSNADKD